MLYVLSIVICTFHFHWDSKIGSLMMESSMRGMTEDYIQKHIHFYCLYLTPVFLLTLISVLIASFIERILEKKFKVKKINL